MDYAQTELLRQRRALLSLLLRGDLPREAGEGPAEAAPEPPETPAPQSAGSAPGRTPEARRAGETPEGPEAGAVSAGRERVPSKVPSAAGST